MEGEIEIDRHNCGDVYNIDPDTGECRVCRAKAEQ